MPTSVKDPLPPKQSQLCYLRW